jgi:uncharacterized protein (TIGR03437 family)
VFFQGKAWRSRAALWCGFLACQRRGIRFGIGAIALSFSPWLGAQQLYSGLFERHDFAVQDTACNVQTTPDPQEFTSSVATSSQSFEIEAPACSFAMSGGSTTIKGHMDMKFPTVTPTAVVTPANDGSGYLNVQFQTPLQLQTATSGFFLLDKVVSSKWVGYSFINGDINDPCPSAGDPSVDVPQGQSLFSATRTCSVNGTIFGYIQQDANGNDVLRIRIYTSMQADLQYINPSSSNADTHVTVTIYSTYVFTPIVTTPIPQINAGGVVNAASLTPKVAPGSLASIFGSNLAASAASAGSPLTTSLGGTSVTIGGYAAPLLYVSATQINCQVPFEVPAGSPADVIVTNAGQTSNTVGVTVGDYAVGVFTYTRTSSAVDPVVTHANYQLVTPANPALPNEALIVYATGIGKLTDRPSTGALASSSPLATAWDEPTVTVGGSPAQVLFAGLAPDFVGLAQLNIQLPANVPAGNLAMRIESPGDSSPSVNLAVGNAPPQPTLSLSTAGLAFGSVTMGHTKDLTVTVSNRGQAALAVSSVSVSGGGFSFVSSPTSFTLQSAGSQILTVRYAPTLGGAANGTLVLNSNDPAQPAVSVALTGQATSPLNVLISDSFNRADADKCNLGQADLALGGSGAHYYLPVFSTGASIISGALQNNGQGYGGVQLTGVSNPCAGVSGESVGQDLYIRLDVLVPTDSAGHISQAGPYLRGRSAFTNDGIFGGDSAGYWIQLESTGQLNIKNLNNAVIIASSAPPASFDTTVFHTVEASTQGSVLQVALDGRPVTFSQNNVANTMVSIPPTNGSNDGAVGIAFGADPNKGPIGGQRAKNLLVSALD